MKCKKCGKQGMLKRYENRILTSIPPQYPWYWWCSCGNTQEGGIEEGIMASEIYKKSWKGEKQ